MARLGVCGWPVGHSRSPAMHAAALAAAGLPEWRYQKLPVPPERFAETVRALPALGFRGVNVTIPHKEAALALADTASVAAREIGAANTLTFEPGGTITAENTDARGLLEAIGKPVRGRRVLVLGAGGSARAAVWALLRGGAEQVQLWNRTPERAEALARELGATAVSQPGAHDIVVNCTAVGLHDSEESFKTLPLQVEYWEAGTLVVDLVYRDGGTLLTRVARERGTEVVGGLEILVAQGAASFERWTGRPASRTAMRAAVEDSDLTT